MASPFDTLRSIRNAAAARPRRSFSFPFARRLSDYLRSLRASDRYIALFLGIMVGITALVSLYALERSFLVRVPATGGTLSEGIIGSPRFVNPLLAITDADRDLTALTYAGLMGRDASGALVPVLASSYEVSSDGRIYTFTIREGAVFSDDTPVSADDVTFTVGKAQDPLLKSPVLSNWANIQVEAVDARTVRFTLPNPYPSFLQNTTLGILPMHIWRDVTNAEFPFSRYAVDPVGAGPYVVSSVMRSETGEIQSYTLESFDRFALGTPPLSTIHMRFYADSAALADAYESGAITSVYGIPEEGALVAPYAQVFGVFFNAAREPLFEDVEVRQALSQAIDRDELARDVLGGFGAPAYRPLPEAISASSSNAVTGLAAARETLEEGGWEFSTTTNAWTKGDRTLAVTLTTANVPELKAIAARIQMQWEQLGVASTLEFSDPGSIAQLVIRPRAFSALLFGVVTGTDPDLFAFWHSSQRADPGLNIANYSDPQVDALLEGARATIDPAVRLDLERQASDRIASSYPAAFTHTPYFTYAVPSGLRGITVAPVTRPSDRFNGVWQWYLRSELVWPWIARRMGA